MPDHDHDIATDDHDIATDDDDIATDDHLGRCDNDVDHFVIAGDHYLHHDPGVDNHKLVSINYDKHARVVHVDIFEHDIDVVVHHVNERRADDSGADHDDGGADDRGALPDAGL